MRQARQAVLVGLAVAGLLGVGVRCAAPEAGCEVPYPAICGDDKCVDLQTDPQNCGACGTSCGSGECSGGLCRCGGTTCPRGSLCCGDTCANLDSDRTNCGVCGTVCPTGIGCTLGVCTGEACPGGCGTGTCCGLGCVDTQSDSNNCGGCGHVCPAGQICQSGSCLVSACSPACTGAERCCGETCTDTNTDPDNCGYCGNRCLDDDPPMADSCVVTSDRAHCSCHGSPAECRPGQLCCDDGCKSVTADPSNCGSCGNACAEGESCRDSTCQCGTTGERCPEGQSCCGGACLDTATDAANCGTCGHICDAVLTDSCVAGECTCGGGRACRAALFPMCGFPLGSVERCCSGACTLIGDTACANCGNACDTGETCTGLPIPFMPPCAFACQAAK